MAFGIDDAITAASSLIKDGIDKIWPNPSDEAAAKVALMKAQADAAIAQLDAANRAANAEAASSDPWTSRARPSFLYLMYLMVLISVPMGVLSAFAPDVAARVTVGMKAFLASIPTDLWNVFLGCFAVYSGGRTWEKVRGVAK
ncbi:3TM-type holin [Nitrospirillum bahiense]|uniref:Holin (3TMs family) n=1 Tax=Nitrospirillum amazonense TaxID=28077 RepID=A0A560F1U5_9PROT|nr:3TM-type holin [Nitrospirillum amazonense]TWB15584.1 holin (3TMs family) [Nitrospirillum amazonense]